MTFASRSIVRLSLLVVGFGLLGLSGIAAERAAPLIPDADYPKVLEIEAKIIEKALESPKDKAMVGRARVAAVMAAAMAQDGIAGGPNDPQRATERDAALKIIDHIDTKNFPAAIALAQQLPSLKPDPAAKPAPVKVFAKTNVQELMTQFSPKGDIISEQALGKLEKSKKLDETLPLKGYQMAILGELSRSITPDKQPKKWEEFAEGMKAASLDLTAAAGKKDAKAVNAAASKLNTACTDCHTIFKGK